MNPNGAWWVCRQCGAESRIKVQMTAKRSIIGLRAHKRQSIRHKEAVRGKS